MREAWGRGLTRRPCAPVDETRSPPIEILKRHTRRRTSCEPAFGLYLRSQPYLWKATPRSFTPTHTGYATRATSHRHKLCVGERGRTQGEEGQASHSQLWLHITACEAPAQRLQPPPARTEAQPAPPRRPSQHQRQDDGRCGNRAWPQRRAERRAAQAGGEATT
jgi:hypothetical protein